MSAPKLIVLMLAFVVIGTPMVYVLWDFLNDALSLRIQGSQVVVALPVLVVFGAFLYFLGRWARGFENSGSGPDRP